MSRVVKVGTLRSPSASAGYLGFYPSFQANTDAVWTDRSGKGNNGTIPDTAVAWATANRVSTSAVFNKAPNLATTVLANNWTWNGTDRNSLLIFFKGVVTVPGSTLALFGNANSTTEGGIKCSINASAQLQINLYDRVNAQSFFGTVGASTLIDASWGSVAHSVAYVLDGPTNTAMIYKDGALLLSQSITSVTNLNSTGDFRPGATHNTAGVASSTYAWHFWKAPTGTTVSWDALIMRLHNSPTLPILQGEVGF